MNIAGCGAVKVTASQAFKISREISPLSEGCRFAWALTSMPKDASVGQSVDYRPC